MDKDIITAMLPKLNGSIGEMEKALGDLADPERDCLELLADRIRSDDYRLTVKIAKWSDERFGTGFNLAYEYFCFRHGGVPCRTDCPPSEYYNCELDRIPDYRYIRDGIPMNPNDYHQALKLVEAALSKLPSQRCAPDEQGVTKKIHFFHSFWYNLFRR
jgi:hypothetical protein